MLEIYDHAAGPYTKEITCAYCKDSHELLECGSRNKPSGSHVATDKDCTARAEEVRILRLKTQHHIPFAEALRRFKKPVDQPRYADVISSKQETQGQRNGSLKEMVEMFKE